MSLKHYHEKNNLYFITTIIENRRIIFKDEFACDLFVNLLTYYKFSCDYNIKAFVIMPDHVHLIIQPIGKYNISEIVKKIKGSFSRYYNKQNKTSGTVFQKGFYDSIIKTEEQLYKTIEYIHYNPVKKGIVAEMGDYLYSSYNFYYKDDDRFKLILIDNFE